VVDNREYKRGLIPAWGLSLYIELHVKNNVHCFLMDCSGSEATWIHNAYKLGIDPQRIEAIFISHWHSDHAGALPCILELIGRKRTPIYAPPEPSIPTVAIERRGGVLIPCDSPKEIFPEVYTTGTVYRRVPEHSLIVHVPGKGLVIFVGCSHPGIENILYRSMQITGVHKVYAVIGGFHISSRSKGYELGVLFRKLGLVYVSPMHCTSDEAREAIRSVIPEAFIDNGVGRILVINKT